MSATLLARSVHGLEWTAAEEIAGRLPSATGLSLARREVAFDLPGLDPRLLELRTVDDVFLRIGHVDGVGTTKDALAGLTRRLARLPFETELAGLRGIRELPDRPLFDVVASLEGRRTYNRFDVENAVGPVLAGPLRGSYLERTSEGRQAGEPDLAVRLFLRGDTAVAAFRLGREPLHRRQYKEDTGPGTLHPPVAAALSRLAGPAGVLLDPFCGDGTIAIESVLSYPDTLVVGGDIDAARLANAQRNARRARVQPLFVRADAVRSPWRPGSVDAVVTNPPWSLAVDAGGRLDGTLRPLWRRLPELLAAGGRVCMVADADLGVPATLRRSGYAIALESRVRLAGRVSHIVLCAPPGAAIPTIGPELAAWRGRAIANGVVTDAGF